MAFRASTDYGKAARARLIAPLEAWSSTATVTTAPTRARSERPERARALRCAGGDVARPTVMAVCAAAAPVRCDKNQSEDSHRRTRRDLRQMTAMPSYLTARWDLGRAVAAGGGGGSVELCVQGMIVVEIEGEAS